jgi:hypothetical protein
LSARSINLEYLKTTGDLWLALGKGVKTCAENDVLPYEVLDKAGTYHNTGAVASHGAAFHVRATAPSFARGGQLEANLIFKHTRQGSTSTCKALHNATLSAVLSGAILLVRNFVFILNRWILY